LLEFRGLIPLEEVECDITNMGYTQQLTQVANRQFAKFESNINLEGTKQHKKRAGIFSCVSGEGISSNNRSACAIM